jgi:tetratricopeptide (TPR) repeat protein
MPRLRLARLLAIAWLLGCAPGLAAEPSAEARRLYAEGKAEYAQGHYVEAIALFERSYALYESPALLFNMAQAHRLAGPQHCTDALNSYKSYLLAQPDAENKREVEERIRELGECPAPQEEAAAAPEPVVAPPPLPPPAVPATVVPLPKQNRVAPSRTGPVLVAGTGAALLVAGGVLYARAWDKHREAEKVCPCYPGTYSNWELLTNVSYALLAVGGAALGGGIAWWAVAEPSGAGQPARAMLGVSGRF